MREGEEPAPASDFGQRVDLPDGLLGAVSHEGLQGSVPLACQCVGQLLTILLKRSNHLHHGPLYTLDQTQTYMMHVAAGCFERLASHIQYP